MADLKPVYRAVSKRRAETALDRRKRKWGQQYPVPSRATQWENSSAYFPLSGEYPQSHLHHECNRIGAMSVQEADETGALFPNENSLLKRFYLGLMNVRWCRHADPELEF